MNNAQEGSTVSLPPADWYPDPRDSTMMRYWDGTAWTGHTQAGPHPAPQLAVPPVPPPAPSSPQQGYDATGARIITSPYGRVMTPGVGDVTTSGDQSSSSTDPSYGAARPKRSKRGLWWGLGVAGVLVLALIAALVVAVLPKFGRLSSGYTGAPVTAEDVAPPGYVAVISDSETVAADIPANWIDATTFADLSTVLAGLPEGVTMIGVWFTDDPGTDPSAQLVMLLEYPPALGSRGTLDDFQRGVVAGASQSATGTQVGATTAFTTETGLEGRRTAISLPYGGDTPAIMVSAAVGHGRRVVVLSWTAYTSSPDEAELQALLESLRIDS